MIPEQFNGENAEKLRQMEAMKREVLTKYLTKEARERLSNLRYAHAELADAVENMILQSAMTNRITGVIDDAKLKEILSVLSQPKNEGKIKFQRKI